MTLIFRRENRKERLQKRWSSSKNGMTGWHLGIFSKPVIFEDGKVYPVLFQRDDLRYIFSFEIKINWDCSIYLRYFWFFDKTVRDNVTLNVL